MKEAKDSEIIIEANGPSPSFSWRELRLYRDLLRSLVLRDWKVRYGQTRLGLLWMVIQPAIAAIVLAFIFGFIVQRDSEAISFPLFVLSGWMCWSYFSSSALQSTQLMPQYLTVMKKVYFPRAILPMSKLLSLFPEFLTGLGLTLIYAGIEGVLSWRALLIPLALPLVALVSYPVSLLFAALGGSYRDIQQLTPYFFQLLFFLSPVVYPSGLLGAYLPDWAQMLLYLNPVTGLMDLFRFILFEDWQMQPQIWWSAVSTTVLTLIGVGVFSREERQWSAEL